MPDRRRIPELDGYRVLMVFIVSWFHIWQQSWLTPLIGGVSLDFLVRAGYMPVDATILLSGFLLFLPYARHMLLGERMPDTRSFYRRRICRVVPSFVFITLAMLFLVALPTHAYPSTGAMVQDIATHLSFTFVFFRENYIGSPLGGSSWTICVEMQMYLLFPLIARLVCRKPGAVLLGMAAVSAYFRGWCVWRFGAYDMVVNQLISFLDVYALGMACALVYVRLRAWWDTLEDRRVPELAATGVLALSVWAGIVILREQARSGTHILIQAGQMIRRPVWALSCAGLMLALPFSVRPVRFLFGCRLMRWLSLISMNYYLIHQNLIVQMRRLNFPYSEYSLPNQMGIRSWQWRYTLYAFGLSAAAAVLVTLLVEKPGAILLRKLFREADRRKARRHPPTTDPCDEKAGAV